MNHWILDPCEDGGPLRKQSPNDTQPFQFLKGSFGGSELTRRKTMWMCRKWQTGSVDEVSGFAFWL
jgi:hypothetical protein